MSAQDAVAIYVETTIPPGMTMSEYRSSRPPKPSLRARLMSHLKPPR